MRLEKREFLLSGLALTSLLAAGPRGVSAAEEAIDLVWSDLVPGEGGTLLESLRGLGVVEHGQMNTPFDQDTAASLTQEYNGMTVRIPGYLVPLSFEGTGVTAALLVPYVGSCIHVPPPPPNQLIFVTSETPYESQGLFEPVYVSGVFGTSATQTQLAEVGYAISGGVIEPYG